MSPAEVEEGVGRLVAVAVVHPLEEADEGLGVVPLLVEPGDRRAIGLRLVIGAVRVHQEAEEGHLAGKHLVERRGHPGPMGVSRLGELASAGIIVEMTAIEVGQLVGDDSGDGGLVRLVEQGRREGEVAAREGLAVRDRGVDQRDLDLRVAVAVLHPPGERGDELLQVVEPPAVLDGPVPLAVGLVEVLGPRLLAGPTLLGEGQADPLERRAFHVREVLDHPLPGGRRVPHQVVGHPVEHVRHRPDRRGPGAGGGLGFARGGLVGSAGLAGRNLRLRRRFRLGGLLFDSTLGGLLAGSPERGAEGECQQESGGQGRGRLHRGGPPRSRRKAGRSGGPGRSPIDDRAGLGIRWKRLGRSPEGTAFGDR